MLDIAESGNISIISALNARRLLVYNQGRYSIER